MVQWSIHKGCNWRSKFSELEKRSSGAVSENRSDLLARRKTWIYITGIITWHLTETAYMIEHSARSRGYCWRHAKLGYMICARAGPPFKHDAMKLGKVLFIEKKRNFYPIFEVTSFREDSTRDLRQRKRSDVASAVTRSSYPSDVGLCCARTVEADFELRLFLAYSLSLASLVYRLNVSLGELRVQRIQTGLTILFDFDVLVTFDNVHYKSSGASVSVPTSTHERIVGLMYEECGQCCKSKAGLVAHHRVHENESFGTNMIAQLVCADCSHLFPTKTDLSQSPRHAHSTQHNTDRLGRKKYSGARWSQQESQSLFRQANNFYPSCESKPHCSRGWSSIFLVDRPSASKPGYGCLIGKHNRTNHHLVDLTKPSVK
ncbi:hypothetical protein CLF_110219 [Clonorchis sinensis]|uniref:C2H2-type domain-containing protein n=1 Tax=Clonorchis sinensis TaxID=79923 RepID=G7YTA3_CLOSI|nr:hypothetical protein CLF_110219 [Clonorchis sinensis]